MVLCDGGRGMLTLYYAPGACSMAAHIVMEESGEKYQPQKVDLANGEQRTEAYLKINPQGRVPVLGLDSGEPAGPSAGAVSRRRGAVGREHRHPALSRQAVRAVAERGAARSQGTLADRL